MKLTKRLEEISKIIDKGSRIADIGTDHGYLPISLLESDTVPFAILSDINKGPLENASCEVKKRNLLDKISLRLGGGLSVLKEDEVDEIIIAGMGGLLISEIIQNDYNICKKAKKLVLQPMQAQEELRKYLLNNNFEIIGEYITNEDFRIYQIIVAKYNDEYKFNGDEIEYEFPLQLVNEKNPLMAKLLQVKINECNSIISNLELHDNEATRQRKKETLNRLKTLESLYIKCK